MTLDEAPDVLTITEAAQLARVGVRQMREAVRRREIYGARLGRSVRVSKYALRRWLEGGDGQAPEPRLTVVGGTDGPGRRPHRA